MQNMPEHDTVCTLSYIITFYNNIENMTEHCLDCLCVFCICGGVYDMVIYSFEQVGYWYFVTELEHVNNNQLFTVKNLL